MYVLDRNEHYYQVITGTDAGNVVLLRDGEVSLQDHDEVMTYRKFFEFSEKLEPLKKLLLPEPIKGNNYAYYN